MNRADVLERASSVRPFAAVLLVYAVGAMIPFAVPIVLPSDDLAGGQDPQGIGTIVLAFVMVMGLVSAIPTLGCALGLWRDRPVRPGAWRMVWWMTLLRGITATVLASLAGALFFIGLGALESAGLASWVPKFVPLATWLTLGIGVGLIYSRSAGRDIGRRFRQRGVAVGRDPSLPPPPPQSPLPI
ncbi:MAG: hypothetical protein AB8G96_08535 [Phycisphaerales bacterium]